MKTELNWKELGRFFAVLVKLFTVITDSFKEAKVGLEVTEWLACTEEGRKVLTDKIREMAAAFVDAHLPRIDTDSDPVIPFPGARVVSHAKWGKVLIENRGRDELWIDGKKAVLYLSERQRKGEKITLRELIAELSGKRMPNACVLDYLFSNRHFIPGSWQTYPDTSVFFTGTEYQKAGCGSCVRCLRWIHGWVWRTEGLDTELGPDDHVIVLED